jgi:hypothetical protein
MTLIGAKYCVWRDIKNSKSYPKEVYSLEINDEDS